MSTGVGQKPPPSSARRDTVVVSHAVEDNEFARWLALQLAACGYRVWCDLTKLLGGENFWADIEQVIRQRAVKFLYVLSKTSNSDQPRGFRKELHIADTESRRNGITDFIIPLAIDDLASGDYNVYLGLRQAIDFRSGWSRGTLQLLKKLDKDRVPKRLKRFNADSVTDWWRQYRSAAGGLRRQPDEYLSNWLSIQQMPAAIYVHTLSETRADSPILDLDFPYPGFTREERFVTFASAAECQGRLGSAVTIASSDCIPVEGILSKSASGGSVADVKKARYSLSRLMKEAWDLWTERQAELGVFEMANKARCSFFFKPAEGDTLKGWYVGLDGARTWRGMTGFWSRKSRRTGMIRSRHWHFGIETRPQTWPHLAARV